MEYFITVDGIPVHINDSKKDGQAILFLHGYFETLYIWEEFFSFFPEGLRLISIDLPGHGLSGYPSPSDNTFFISDFVRDLLKKLSVDRCSIITHLCGYYIACQFSSIYPESVVSIINIGSRSLLDKKEISFINSLKSSISDDTFLKFSSSFIPRMYNPENLHYCDEKIQETIEICETHDPEGISFFLDSILSYTSFSTTIPVLSIIGDHQLFDDISDDNHPSTVIVPCTGANPFIERPNEVFSVISSFLNL